LVSITLLGATFSLVYYLYLKLAMSSSINRNISHCRERNDIGWEKKKEKKKKKKHRVQPGRGFHGLVLTLHELFCFM